MTWSAIYLAPRGQRRNRKQRGKNRSTTKMTNRGPCSSARVRRVSRAHWRRDSKNELASLGQGVFQAFRGFLQLALKGINLLRYIIKLFPCQRSCLCNFLHFAIRFAHGGPNFHGNTSEPALFCHRDPP